MSDKAISFQIRYHQAIGTFALAGVRVHLHRGPAPDSRSLPDFFFFGNPFLGKLNPLPVLDLTSYSVSSSPTREAYSQCFNTDIIFEFREVLCYYIFSRLTYSSQIANVFFPSVLSQNKILNSTAGSLLKVCRLQE